MSELMERLSGLARMQLEAQRSVEAAELHLQEAKKNLTTISEVTIPTVMEELELEEFTTQDGLRIQVARQVFGGITEANRAAAFAWLRKEGHGGIIKSKLEAQVNDAQQLEKLQQQLADQGIITKDASNVHYQTLGKWVREMQAAGREIPPAITVSEKTVSKITLR